ARLADSTGAAGKIEPHAIPGGGSPELSGRQSTKGALAQQRQDGSEARAPHSCAQHQKSRLALVRADVGGDPFGPVERLIGALLLTKLAPFGSQALDNFQITAFRLHIECPGRALVHLTDRSDLPVA